MPSRFFTASKKWPEAVRKALSFITDLPEQGDIDEPLFLFGPPVHGRLPFRIGLGGRTALSCELGGDYPFLQELREWMERCLAFDRHGVFHPEIATFDTVEGVLHLLMVHAGWERSLSTGACSVSELIAVESDCDIPAFRCFCRTRETVRSLYAALLDAVRRYGEEIDEAAVRKREQLSPYLGLSTTARMESALRSETIEMKTRFDEKSNFDEMPSRHTFSNCPDTRSLPGNKPGAVYSSNPRFPSTNLDISSFRASESSVGRISILSASPR